MASSATSSPPGRIPCRGSYLVPPEGAIHKCIQNSAKHLRWSFIQLHIMVLNLSLFSRKTFHLKCLTGSWSEFWHAFPRFCILNLILKIKHFALYTVFAFPLVYLHTFSITSSRFSHLNTFHHDILKSSYRAQQMPICGALRDLVPLVQFKKREKHPWRSVTFCKVAFHVSPTVLPQNIDFVIFK